MSQIAQYRGTGKRKTSVARVILRPGDGATWVNGKTLEEYFPRMVHRMLATAPLKTAALEKADFGDERFDKVFAFNVAPFWQQPERALGAVREHLARDGAVYIFWDARHFAPEGARDLGNELADRLREGGFSVDRVLVEGLRPVPRSAS